MKRKILGSIACLLLITGCGKATLQDGREAVTTFKEGGISVETLYDSLKNKYGIETLIDLIDSELLEREYDKTTEENKYVNDNIKSIKATVKDKEYDFDSYIKYYYNADSADELKDYFRLNYRRQLWMNDHIKNTVTEKEIESYYEDVTIGDIDLSWILITVDAKNDDKEDIKNKAEAEALATAKEIIKKLDNKEKFSDLAKTYSDDNTSKNNGGSLGKVNRSDISEELIEAANKLNKDAYSKTPVKTSEGYAILYVNNKDKKPEFNDETKNEIVLNITDEKMTSDNGTLYIKSLEALRSKYAMTLKDSDLSDDYTEYMNKLKNSINK